MESIMHFLWLTGFHGHQNPKNAVITAITWFNVPSFEMNAKFENILKVSIENIV